MQYFSIWRSLSAMNTHSRSGYNIIVNQFIFVLEEFELICWTQVEKEQTQHAHYRKKKHWNRTLWDNKKTSMRAEKVFLAVCSVTPIESRRKSRPKWMSWAVWFVIQNVWMGNCWQKLLSFPRFALLLLRFYGESQEIFFFSYNTFNFSFHLV